MDKAATPSEAISTLRHTRAVPGIPIKDLNTAKFPTMKSIKKGYKYCFNGERNITSYSNSTSSGQLLSIYKIKVNLNVKMDVTYVDAELDANFV